MKSIQMYILLSDKSFLQYPQSVLKKIFKRAIEHIT